MASLSVKIGEDGRYRPMNGHRYAGTPKYNAVPAGGFGPGYELVAELLGSAHPKTLCVDFNHIRFDNAGIVTHCGTTTRRLITKKPMPTDKTLGPLCAYIQKNDLYHNKRACLGGVDADFLAYGVHLCAGCVERVRARSIFKDESTRSIAAALLYSQRPVGERDMGLLSSVSIFLVAATLFAPKFAPFLQPARIRTLKQFRRVIIHIAIVSPFKLGVGTTWGLPSTIENDLKAVRMSSKDLLVLNGFAKTSLLFDLESWGIKTDGTYVYSKGLIRILKALYASSILVYADPHFYHGSVALQSWVADIPHVVVVTVGSYARLELGLITPDIPVYDLELDDTVDFSGFQTVFLYGANLFEPRHWRMILDVPHKIAMGNPRAIPPLHLGNVFHQLTLVHELQAWPATIKIVSSPILVAIDQKLLAPLESCIVVGEGVDIYDLYCGPASMRAHRMTFGLILTSWSQLYYLYYFSPRAANVTILRPGILRAFSQNLAVPVTLYTDE